MELVLGGFVVLCLLFLIGAAATGRVKIRSCCSIADLAKDLRMRAAFEQEDSEEDLVADARPVSRPPPRRNSAT